MLKVCFSRAAGKKFITKDVNNDIDIQKNCTQYCHGAWWFTRCLRSHLNGEYLVGGHSQPFECIVCGDFKGQEYSYKGTEM